MNASWFVVFFLPTLVFTSNNNDDESFQLVSRGLKEYFHSNGTYIPNYLMEALKSHQFPNLFRHTEQMEKVYDNVQVCFTCELAVDLIIDARKAGLDKEVILNGAEFICTAFGIENERVCNGAIAMNIDVILYILDNRENITSQRICGLFMQDYNCETGDEFVWEVKIPEGNPPERAQPSGGEPIKILHLSDVHYDPLYKPNGNADCKEPVCCQSDQGEPSSDGTTCGYWTDYRDADSPWHLVEETIRQVKTHNADYIYYTGDIISHRVWETSVESNTNDITKFYEYMAKEFENTPKYYIMGNHETHPINLWASQSVDNEELSTQWLLDLVAQFYSNDTQTQETIRKGGYYTTTLESNPKFRVIGLNTNIAYTANFWLLFDDIDPFNQLQWLADTLKAAEENDEKVHMIYHVPSGSSSMLKVWSREFNRIIQRFSSTISGQFCGHTHRDQFYVFYNSSNPTQAISASFNGASVTPYSSANPSYKIFYVDPVTFQLLDYEEWTFNLTLANLQPSTQTPEWYKLYSFTEAYNVTSLEPDQIDSVLYNMAQNHNLLDDYFRYKVRNGDDGIQWGCDSNCQKDNLCEIATSQFGDNTQCKYFKDLYDEYMNTPQNGK